MRDLTLLPEGFHVTGIDIRGGVMYIEGNVRFEGVVRVVTINGHVSSDDDLDPPVTLDYSNIDNSLRSGEMSVPSGLTPEERRQYVSNELSKIPAGVKQL